MRKIEALSTTIFKESEERKIIGVAGRGGTNWATVESIRAKDNLGLVFRDWGYQQQKQLFNVTKSNVLR